MAEVLNPIYYATKDAVTVTSDRSTLDTALAGAGASVDALVAELIDQLDSLRSSGGSKTLKFLIQSAGGTVSSVFSQAIEVVVDPDKDEFSVGGVVLDVVGGAAVTAIISFLSPGVILALSAGQAAFTYSLIWSAVKAASELDEDIINLIDGTIPVDIQLVDQNNNVISGALFKEGLSEEQELEAIQKLLERMLTRFPDILIGGERIRVVEDTSFFPREKEYKIYDGSFVNAISQELGITKETLLGLGQENSPNTNAQIYYESPTFNPKSFVFASDENRFFVPLPNTTGGVSPVGLHPGNIISGSSGNDTLDAFQDRDSNLLFNQQNVLLLGLDGDDSIKGNVEDDIIVGGKGNDTIDGGSGRDIAIFSDVLENYKISLSAIGNVTISHVKGTRTDGTDTLINVEFVKFRENVLSVADLKPSQQIGSYEVKQVSADDVVGSLPVISGTQVFWQEKVGSSAFSDDRTIRFDTNTSLLSGITSNTTDSSYAQLPVNEDKILLSVDYNDRSPDKLELYTGESLVRVGNVSDFGNRAKIFGDNILLETRPGFQLVAYNYRNGATTLLADRPSNSLGLPSFPGVSSVLTSGKNAAWVGSIGGSIGDIFFYNGQTTVQIPEINEVNGVTYNRFPSNLQIDGNKLFWTSSSPTNGSLRDMFLYDGVETRKIGEVSAQVLDFKFSGNRVVWTTKEIIRDTPTIDTILHRLYLYDGGSIKSIYEVEKTTELSTAGIRNLTFSGENIVWTETVAAAFNPRIAVGQDFYLYDIGNSNAQPKLLSNNVDTLLYDFSFELFEEQVAWTAPDNVGKTQLYAYDGNSVWQLTNLPPNNGGYGNYISQFDVSEKGVVWIGDDDGEMDRSFKVGEEIFVATLIREGGIENNPAIPIPTPTPIPTPNPTPMPTPTPTPEPSTLPSLARIADDIFSVSGGTANKPKLQITILDSSPSSVNELAVFTVDDAQGRINGIAPTETAYTQAALSRAKVIFSMLANAPQGFDPKSLNRSLEFDSGDNLRFLLIKNDTLDSVRNENVSNPSILFSNVSSQRITASSTGGFTLAWEDGNGNSSDFKDFVVSIQATDTPLPLGANLQDQQQGEVLDLSGVDPTKTVQAKFTVSREAAYNNSVGFYKVIDYQGTIIDPLTGISLNPEDSGYVEAAIKNRVSGIDLQTANQSTVTINGVFQGGSIFAPFIIANGSVDQLLDTDKSNDPSVYFAYSGANAGRVDHIRLLGNNVFGFEDLPRGGDFDYNDMVIKTDLSII
jgi:hypothetical protein